MDQTPAPAAGQPVCTICGQPYSNLIEHMRDAH